MFKQIWEITLMNLRNLRSRIGSSSVIVVGIAGVVAVLVGLLSMASGFTAALQSTSKPDRALVMRDGSTGEMPPEHHQHAGLHQAPRSPPAGGRGLPAIRVNLMAKQPEEQVSRNGSARHVSTLCNYQM